MQNLLFTSAPRRRCLRLLFYVYRFIVIRRIDQSTNLPANTTEAFAPSSEILWHERGSAMPPPGWWEQTRGFPERVTGGNRWVTQYGGPFYYAKKKSS